MLEQRPGVLEPELAGTGFRWKRKIKIAGHQAEQRLRRLSFTELIWVFAVGCLAGFILESLLHSLQSGALGLKPGLIYGPLCPVYGSTAVLSFILLRHRGDLAVLLGGAAIGGLMEYLSNLMLEKCLHISLWDYSGQPFSVAGRTTLLMMFIFGLNALICLKMAGPRLVRLLQQISIKPRRLVTWVLTVCLAADLLLTGAAVWRWSERHQDRAADNICEERLDKAYPDEMLSEIFPGLTLLTRQL